MKKASDEEIKSAYNELGNIWKVADRFGMCGQSVHERLCKIGIQLNNRPFSKDEERILQDHYLDYKKDGKLEVLARHLNRTKPFICRKAKDLGLTNKRHEKKWLKTWSILTEEEARPIWDDFKKSSLDKLHYCKSKGYPLSGFDHLKKLFPDEWDHVIELKQPKQTKYRTGRYFEYVIRDLFKSHNYFALRSPQSRSPLDIIAIKHGIVIMVQCKRGGYCSPDEWNKLYKLAMSCGSTPLIAFRSGKSKIELKKITGPKTGQKTRQPWIDYEIE